MTRNQEKKELLSSWKRSMTNELARRRRYLAVQIPARKQFETLKNRMLKELRAKLTTREELEEMKSNIKGYEEMMEKIRSMRHSIKEYKRKAKEHESKHATIVQQIEDNDEYCAAKKFVKQQEREFLRAHKAMLYKAIKENGFEE